MIKVSGSAMIPVNINPTPKKHAPATTASATIPTLRHVPVPLNTERGRQSLRF